MTEQHERYANELEEALNEFSKNVNKILEKIFIFKGETKKDWEMESDFEDGDEYYYLTDVGEIDKDYWEYLYEDGERFDFGNIFKTLQEAELEGKRRKLLTRFRAFRDECNNGWKPNWKAQDPKYYLYYSGVAEKISLESIYYYTDLSILGYFKNGQDAQRAIDLFGDEIKELFVEV